MLLGWYTDQSLLYYYVMKFETTQPNRISKLNMHDKTHRLCRSQIYNWKFIPDDYKKRIRNGGYSDLHFVQ